MTAPRPDVVHQVHFEWRHNGMKVVGGSLPDEDMQAWLRRLDAHLRLPPPAGGLPPPWALSRLELPDGYTAVVHRGLSAEAPGRNDATALIAPTSLLPLPAVLGLDYNFAGIRTPAHGPEQPLEVAELGAADTWRQQTLRNWAKERPELLRRALARLLDAPTSPLTIVGCPDQLIFPLLWGLHRLADRHLQGLGTRRPWTFSTYEVDDADSVARGLAIVFLPDRSSRGADSRRTLVNVHVDQKVSSDSGRLAAGLVERFLADYEDWVAVPVPERSTTVEQVPGDRGELVMPSEHRRAGTGAPNLSATVDRIRAAHGPADLDAGMTTLERATAAPGDRAALRSFLRANGYADLARLAVRLLPAGTSPHALVHRLRDVVFALDRSDLFDRAAAAFAFDVLEHRPPSALGAAVLADLTAVYGPETVREEIGERWLRAHPVVVPEPPDQLFLSYAREDDPAARTIVALLRAAGFTVWFDDGLRAGDEWWPEILRRIRGSAAVVLVASEHARTSKPCELELRYVEDLGLPIVPVRVGEVRGLRAWAVARRHLVDFTEADNEATARLVSGVVAAVRRWAPLPDPLPDEPAAPFAYLAELRRQLDRDDLSREDQRRILDELREHLFAEPEASVRDEICALLTRLADHPDARGLVIRDARAALADAAARRGGG